MAKTRYLIVAFFILPLAFLVIAVGCQTGPVIPPVSKGDTATYVGNAACAECHRNEFLHQQETQHAQSLRHADLRSLGALAPPVGVIPGTYYAIQRQGDLLKLVRADRPEIGTTLQYAFGSGSSVMTYVGENKSDRLTELRMSYSPAEHKWYVTPGQEAYANLEMGHVFQLGMASRCVLCHADRLSANSIAPADGSLGIGCESCHGPGSAHIAAARVPHAPDLKVEKMHDWGAARINAMCGKCHRAFDDVPLVGNDANNTARFQPYGLELSPCYKKSGDRLSCITCHDPHTDAGADTSHYESICIACHSHDAPARRFTYPVDVALRKVCPVNRTGRCIGCHMPTRQIMPASKVPLSIADHLIWAYPVHH